MAKILLIEDQLLWQRTLSRLLQQEGHEVVLVGSYEEAQSNITDTGDIGRTFDLVLLDLVLEEWGSEVEGKDLLPLIEGKNKSGRAKVILFTDQDTPGDSVEVTHEILIHHKRIVVDVYDKKKFGDGKGFLELVQQVLELVKEVFQSVGLTWEQLCELCKDISQHRMATVRGKYDPKLYLRREKTYQTLEKFIHAKDKKCFVLIGKSGVGKSNFILAAGEELLRSYSKRLCVLIYDAAHLNVAPSVTKFISQDFDDRLGLPDSRVEDIWREIQHIEGIEESLVILFVDAINENSQAKTLLRQIDKLIQKPWPWLKVVCSSRPETWQTIKRGVKVAQKLYYREEKAEKIGVELEPFSYSEQMEPFSRQELPEVYAKYQQRFNVRTSYEELIGEQRELLCDPLSLWLVASIYQGTAIPKTLQATDLIEQYVNALLKSERLSNEDIRLLETQLAPLMVKERHYSNVIAIADINKFGESSLTNLLDTDILSRQVEGSERTITFKYERFYDYFIGKALFEKYRKETDKVAFLEELFADLNDNLFLWGALRQLFSYLLKTKEYLLVEQLGSTNNGFQADLLVSGLSEYYQRYQSDLHPILLKWLEGEYQESLAPIITANVAIACQIESILECILVHQHKDTRYLAIQNIHTLWKTNPELTAKILHTLPNYINLIHLKRSYIVLNTLVYVSMLLVLGDYSDVGSATQTFETIQNLWKPVIEKVLLVSQHRFFERGLKRVRRFIAAIVSNLGLNYIKSIQREGFPFSFRDLKRFFPADERQKEIIKHLSLHFDAFGGETTESVEDLVKYIEELVQNGDDNCIIFYAAQLAVIAHIIANPLRTAQALDTLFERLDDLYPPTQNQDEPTASFWNTFVNVFICFPYKQMTREEAEPILKILARTIRTREFRYLNRIRYGCGEVQSLGNTAHTLYGYYFNIPEAGPDLLKKIVHFEMQRNDSTLIARVVPALAMSVGRQDMPEAGLEALSDFLHMVLQIGYLNQLDEKEQTQFWQEVIRTLSQARVVEKYQQYIFELLERFEPGALPESLVVQVRGDSRKDYTAFYAGEAAFQSWIRSLYDPNPSVRNFLKWLFYTASEAKSLNEFVLEVIIYWVELLYPGKSLFSKKQTYANTNRSYQTE